MKIITEKIIAEKAPGVTVCRDIRRIMHAARAFPA